jgi:hypothetical protein
MGPWLRTAHELGEETRGDILHLFLLSGLPIAISQLGDEVPTLAFSRIDAEELDGGVAVPERRNSRALPGKSTINKLSLYGPQCCCQKYSC